MLCPEHLRVQAHFDGEVDALSALEIERHLERCAECRELHAQLSGVRAALRTELRREHVPPALAARIAASLEDAAREQGPASGPREAGQSPSTLRRWRLRPFWAGAVSGVGASLLVAAACLALWLPGVRAEPLAAELVDAHLRSLMPEHLLEVLSSDRHTVKPWFAGHADVSPAVADFEAQGYPLAGGRADYLDHQRAAVIVYRHGAHIINVFSWAADRHALPPEQTRHGYRLLSWRAGDLQYCAVSDAGWEELRRLQELLLTVG